MSRERSAGTHRTPGARPAPRPAQRPARWTVFPLALALAVAVVGCQHGGPVPIDAWQLRDDRTWIAVPEVPPMLQAGERDCGAAAAAMLLGYWGIPTEQRAIRAASTLPEDQALSAAFLRAYLRDRGLQAFLIQGTEADLERELRAGHPVIVGVVRPHLLGGLAHYLVVVGINRSSGQIAVIDPADGWRDYTFEGFAREWSGAKQLALVANLP
jgi:hypothetical protein